MPDRFGEASVYGVNIGCNNSDGSENYSEIAPHFAAFEDVAEMPDERQIEQVEV